MRGLGLSLRGWCLVIITPIPTLWLLWLRVHLVLLLLLAGIIIPLRWRWRGLSLLRRRPRIMLRVMRHLVRRRVLLGLRVLRGRGWCRGWGMLGPIRRQRMPILIICVHRLLLLGRRTPRRPSYVRRIRCLPLRRWRPGVRRVMCMTV